ncbi:MAG TPA: SdpI family protein [Gemmatimonadaceae bacterium]|nr:SdpI family protein [Gemmatimonadaceae bacterium]
MRKWLPVFPLALALGLSAVAYGRLPSTVAPSWTYILPIDAAPEPMPRAAVVLLFPVVALVVWGGLVLLARIRGQRAGVLPERLAANAIARFEPTYHVIVLAVVSLLTLMHIALVASAAQWPLWTFKAVGAALGVGLFLVGNLMPRVRPNWIAGIRTRATLADPDLWQRTHRYFGVLLMLSGVAVAIIGIVMPRYAFVVLFAGIILSAIIAQLWGAAGKRSVTAAVAVIACVLAAASAYAQSSVREERFDIRATGVTLPGTLALPDHAKPDVIVIVAGSGPTDRDGNGLLAQTDLYKQIAHALADSGFASLRYDKRGIGATQFAVDHTALSVDDYAGDVMAAVDTLIAGGRFGRVFLLGHSEGAMHVVLAANRGARVAGVILLSATGRTFADVLHDQFSLATDSATVSRIDSAFALFVRGGDPVDEPEIAAPVLVPIYRTMLASMAAYNPPGEVAKLARPPLVITGAMDWQTSRKDFEALRASRADGTYLLLDSANHVLKHAESLVPASQQATYHDKSIPVVPELVPAIVRWLRG